MDARDELNEIVRRAESPVEGEAVDERFGRIVELAQKALDELGPMVDWAKLGKVLFICGGIALILGLGLIPNWTQWTYECIWANTTGRPWTHVMRDNPYLLMIPAAVIVLWLARFLPLKYWARVLLMFSVFGIAFVSGHVLWGQDNPDVPPATICPVSLFADEKEL